MFRYLKISLVLLIVSIAARSEPPMVEWCVPPGVGSMWATPRRLAEPGGSV